MAEPFAKRFGVTGVFNDNHKRVFVVPFVFLSMTVTSTVNEENHVLTVSLRHRPWGWQVAA